MDFCYSFCVFVILFLRIYKVNGWESNDEDCTFSLEDSFARNENYETKDVPENNAKNEFTPSPSTTQSTILLAYANNPFGNSQILLNNSMRSSFKTVNEHLFVKMLHCSKHCNTQLLNAFQKHLAKYSTTIKPVVVSDRTEENKKQLQEYDHLSKIVQKKRIKKPQKPPFVKNLFLGVFDRELLAYPQIEKDELKPLEEETAIAERFVSNDKSQESSSLTKECLQNLKQQKYLGFQCSQFLGAREVGVREHCRFSEALNNYKLKHNVMGNELCIQTLSKFGNESQQVYLKKLIDGEILAAFCGAELNSSHVGAMETKATLLDDNKTWEINGAKSYVLNGHSADLYIILAETTEGNPQRGIPPALTAFLVNSNAEGITTVQCDTNDPSGFEIANVSLHNVKISADDVIGNVGDGSKIIGEFSRQQRLNSGIASTVSLKKLSKNLADHFLNMNTGSVELHTTEAVTSNIGEIFIDTYAVESATYYTAGLMDEFENQDCDLEAAIVKVLAAEKLYNSTTLALTMIGTPAILSNHWANQQHRDSVTNLLLDENIDNLKIIIALMGIQHVGQHINDSVKKMRNPMFNALFAYQNMWKNRRQVNDNPKLNLNLKEYLHPSCMNASDQLEYSVLRLQFFSEMLLMRYGTDIVNKHLLLRMLADVAIEVYAMTTSLSRASRAYCIGLEHANLEMVAANAVCKSGTKRVRDIVGTGLNSLDDTNSDNTRILAKRLFKFKEYYPPHPLSRNF